MGEQCACVKNDGDAVDTQLIFSEHLIEALDSHARIAQEEIPGGAFLPFPLGGTDHDSSVLPLDVWGEGCLILGSKQEWEAKPHPKKSLAYMVRHGLFLLESIRFASAKVGKLGKISNKISA